MKININGSEIEISRLKVNMTSDNVLELENNISNLKNRMIESGAILYSITGIEAFKPVYNRALNAITCEYKAELIFGDFANKIIS